MKLVAVGASEQQYVVTESRTRRACDFGYRADNFPAPEQRRMRYIHAVSARQQ